MWTIAATVPFKILWLRLKSIAILYMIDCLRVPDEMFLDHPVSEAGCRWWNFLPSMKSSLLQKSAWNHIKICRCAFRCARLHHLCTVSVSDPDVVLKPLLLAPRASSADPSRRKDTRLSPLLHQNRWAKQGPQSCTHGR